MIYKDVLAHLSSKQKEDAERSIMKVTKQKEQERGGSAFGHLTTGGVLSANMEASIKQHGGIYLPLKGYSMKYVYMSSIHKRKVGGRIKTDNVRESPHHATNQRKTWTLRTQQAVSTSR